MTMDYTAVDENRIQVPNVKRGNLLVVTAPVVRAVNGVYEVDADTANNLRSYLENFSHVTLACPVQIQGSGQMWRSLPFRMLEDGDRFHTFHYRTHIGKIGIFVITERQGTYYVWKY